MKIIEAQSAHLSNYEVLAHVESMRARFDAASSNGASSTLKSGNLETVIKELADHLRTPPSPLHPPSSYTPRTIKELFTALKPYRLTKAELLMILNLRPQSEGLLYTIIEDFDDRFQNSEVTNMMTVIANVLGADDTQADGQAAENAEDSDMTLQ
ncbi:MAG: hypothetical protein M1826_004388 [Phylliscum demangeonii]|nr:MAG: hypothetical protein M1826_004388 [Phylliscum demangeonii]